MGLTWDGFGDFYSKYFASFDESAELRWQMAYGAPDEASVAEKLEETLSATPWRNRRRASCKKRQVGSRATRWRRSTASDSVNAKPRNIAPSW